MNTKYFLHITLLSGSMLLSAAGLFSQDKKEPPVRTIDVENTIQRDTVPKIELPEFVITGKEKIELPNDPKIEISEIRFFTPPRNLPVNITERDFSTAEIETPQKKLTVFGREKSIFANYLRIGYGRYNTPFAAAGVFLDYGKSKIGIEADFIKSDGHVSDAGFTNGNAKIFYRTELPEYENLFDRASIGLDLGYSIDKFKFYGEKDNFKKPFPGYASIMNNPERTGTSFWIKSSISSENLVFLDYNAYAGFKNYQIKDMHIFDYWAYVSSSCILCPREEDVSLEQNSMFGGFDLTKKLDSWKFSLNTYFSYNPVKRTNFINTFTKFSSVDFRIQKQFMPYFELEIGAKYFMFRDLNRELWIDTKDKFKLFPHALVRGFIRDNIIIYAKYDPSVIENSFESANTAFRYLNSSSMIYHFINKSNYSFGVDYFINRESKVNLQFSYTEQENSPVYISSYLYPYIHSYDTSLIYNGWRTDYSDKYSKKFFGSLRYYYQIAEKTDFNVSVYYTDYRMGDIKLPYSPELVFQGSFNHEFSFKLFLRPEILIISSRKANFAINMSERSLDPYVLLNFYSEYPIITNMKIFMNLTNIINQKYQVYEGYSAIPFSFNFGLNFRI